MYFEWIENLGSLNEFLPFVEFIVNISGLGVRFSDINFFCSKFEVDMYPLGFRYLLGLSNYELMTFFEEYCWAIWNKSLLRAYFYFHNSIDFLCLISFSKFPLYYCRISSTSFSLWNFTSFILFVLTSVFILFFK